MQESERLSAFGKIVATILGGLIFLGLVGAAIHFIDDWSTNSPDQAKFDPTAYAIDYSWLRANARTLEQNYGAAPEEQLPYRIVEKIGSVYFGANGSKMCALDAEGECASARYHNIQFWNGLFVGKVGAVSTILGPTGEKISGEYHFFYMTCKGLVGQIGAHMEVLSPLDFNSSGQLNDKGRETINHLNDEGREQNPDDNLFTEICLPS